jgi:XTP/dITP diphosphohydrolase
MAHHQLLIASTNQGKIREIAKILSDLPVTLISLSQMPRLNNLRVRETGDTFKDNAILKVQAYGEASGLITIADDSGLTVDALNGRPGVHSKRYGKSDHHRIIKLLDELKKLPHVPRTAHFISAVAIYHPQSKKIHTAIGKTSGRITHKPHGKQGFGFDPIFYSPLLEKTFGQAKAQEKNRVSHRAKSLRKAKKIIKKLITSN